MKITLYTIKDCAFSKQEKEYLKNNKLAFEEKDLETNKDFLTEMLAISNNFAGTPVTRVEKDDGTISVLKGFTKEEFDTTFGFAATPPVADAAKAVEETPKVEENKTPTEVVPPVETPVTATPDPLKSVMDDLQSKSEPIPTPSTEQPSSVLPTESTPQPTTETPPANAPTIPDFPAK